MFRCLAIVTDGTAAPSEHLTFEAASLDGVPAAADAAADQAGYTVQELFVSLAAVQAVAAEPA